jgi:zinc protease
MAESTLTTGLDVVAARTGGVPLATMALVIKGGASTDPAGKAGLATMAADLATRGTRTRSAQQIAAEMESLGATLSGFATPDGAVLWVSAPTANLEPAGTLLADIAANATFPAEEVERERRRALDGLSIAMKDPGQLASMVALPVMYGAAPYGMLPQGTPASLGALTRDDLAAHHRQWWHPGNSALVIAGGIEPAEAKAIAGRLFGAWKGEGAPPAAPAERAGAPRPPRTLVIDMPGSGQAAVVAAVRGVDRADPDYYNLVVANAVLGSGSNGRLFEEIRTKRALSYGAYSSMPARADDAVLTAQAQTKNETAAEVVKVFLDEFDRLGRDPFAADAIEKRKAFITGGYIRQSETSSGFAAALANLIMQGLPPAEDARYAERIDAVDAAGAGAAAGNLVAGDRATVVVVGDAAMFLEKLKAVRKDVEVVKSDQLDLDAAALERR